jgi:SAM-dependent methyltransferase
LLDLDATALPFGSALRRKNMDTRESQEQRLCQSVRDFYDSPSSVQYYGAKLEQGRLFPPEEALVDKYLTTPGCLLDIGCGTGRITFYLARRGFPATGLDVSSEMVAYGNKFAAAHDLPQCLQCGDGKRLPFAAASFDYVLLISQMIHHVPLRTNRVGLLAEAKRVCKPQGTIILTFHDYETVKKLQAWDPDWVGDPEKVDRLRSSCDVLEQGDAFGDNCQGTVVDHPGYVHNCTLQEMREEVRDAGLQVISSDSYGTIVGGEFDRFWGAVQVFTMQTPKDRTAPQYPFAVQMRLTP